MGRILTSDDIGSAPPGRMSFKPMGVLTHQERRLIKDLRICSTPHNRLDKIERQHLAALSEALRTVLTLVAKEARNEDLAVFPPHSAFVNDEELAILGGMALLQRPSKSASWHLTNGFQLSLKDCADQLLLHGRRLPLRQVFTPAQVERSCFQLDKMALACAHRSAKERCSAASQKWDGHVDPEPGTRKGQAVSLVRMREAVPVGVFLEAGISRQYLSQLCKRGYIEKASHGLYRLPRHLKSNYDD